MTLREYLIREEIAFGRKDISKIGSLCISKAKQMGVAYKKKWQQEPYFKIKREYFVIDYPESFLPTLFEIVHRYFSDKETLLSFPLPADNPEFPKKETFFLSSKVIEKKKRPRIKTNKP